MTFLLIIPGGWGDEFEDDGSVNEKDQKAENTEQPQKEKKQETIPSDTVELLSSKKKHARLGYGKMRR